MKRAIPSPGQATAAGGRAPCSAYLSFLKLGLVLALLQGPVPLFGTTRETLSTVFAQANEYYQRGDFVSAEQRYRQILEKGVESGTLYYNLGNVCFKQKKLGESICFWEKARRLLPGDPDTLENLALAKLLVVDRIEMPPDPLPLRWLDSALHRFTLVQDSWAVLILFIVANAFLATCLLAKNARLAGRTLIAAGVTGLLALVFGCSLAFKIYEENHRTEGVVVEQKADVRSGPGAENVTVFTLHEGILLRIRGESDGWYQVSLPNGWSGWLEKGRVRVI
jgi:tetratricopeptide (TPR) repeat protein